MHVYIGSEQGDGLVCPPTPAETSIMQMVPGDSIWQNNVFDEPGRHEDHVEWDGMMSVDKSGNYRKMHNSSVQGTLCKASPTRPRLRPSTG